MASKQSKRQLLLLAKEVKQGELTPQESYQIENAFERSSKLVVKNRVVESIAIGLRKSEGQVQILLNASDNSDRVIQDIENILNEKDAD